VSPLLSLPFPAHYDHSYTAVVKHYYTAAFGIMLISSKRGIMLVGVLLISSLGGYPSSVLRFYSSILFPFHHWDDENGGGSDMTDRPEDKMTLELFDQILHTATKTVSTTTTTTTTTTKTTTTTILIFILIMVWTLTLQDSQH